MTENEHKPNPAIGALFELVFIALLAGVGSAIVYGVWSFVLGHCS